MGPTVNGLIIALCRSPPALPSLQATFADAGIQTWMLVPPQFDEISPMGTPSVSWRSRPTSQHTAENSFHAGPPRTCADAAVQFDVMVRSSASGVVLVVPDPSKRRHSVEKGAHKRRRGRKGGRRIVRRRDMTNMYKLKGNSVVVVVVVWVGRRCAKAPGSAGPNLVQRRSRRPSLGGDDARVHVRVRLCACVRVCVRACLCVYVCVLVCVCT